MTYTAGLLLLASNVFLIFRTVQCSTLFVVQSVQ